MGGMVAKLNRYSVVCSILMLALAGCATPAEKQAAAARRVAPTAVVMKSQTGTPEEDGTMQHSRDGYPTFNGPLTAANVQINDQQATDLQKQLTALGAKRKAGTITQAEYDRRVAEMRKLAADHGPDTLSEIQK